jgi:Protein of unknown function (DUF1822)
MNSSIFELNPASIWLEFSEEDRTQAWQKTIDIAAEEARYHTHLNLISQQLLLPYFHDYDAKCQFAADGADFWSLGVNGSPITINGQRCIVLASDDFDRDEFRIPQEWVDSPELAADFYLAVQIDNEENLLRVWGYTTCSTLKRQGHYCSRDRSYFLEQDQVCTDVNSLWLLQENYPAEISRPEIAPLPKLSLDRLLEVLDDLAQTNLLFLRRSLDFAEWGALLANPQWRSMLLTKRHPIIQQPNSAVTNLGKWLENMVEEGWQSVEQLIAPQLRGSFMGNQTKRAKLIDLQLDLAGQQVVLMITVGRSDHKSSIQASIYPTKEVATLPPQLKLTILQEDGQLFKEVTARSDDEFIRYKFQAAIGDRFSIKVELGEASFVEPFQA